MTTILTILCICNTIAVLLLLVKSGFHRSEPKDNTPQSSETPNSELDPIELEREKRKVEDELKAFQELMNYNADVAYGIKHMEE